MEHVADRLHNGSCPKLAHLAERFREARMPDGFWRRALTITLLQIGRRDQEALARRLAADILQIASVQVLGKSRRYPQSADRRALLEGLRKLEKQRYPRTTGDPRDPLTPTSGFAPVVLGMWLRDAKEAFCVSPFTRHVVDRQFARVQKQITRNGRSGKPLTCSEEVWLSIKGEPSTQGKAWAFVAAIAGVKVESLKKTLQRAGVRSES